MFTLCLWLCFDVLTEEAPIAMPQMEIADLNTKLDGLRDQKQAVETRIQKHYENTKKNNENTDSKEVVKYTTGMETSYSDGYGEGDGWSDCDVGYGWSDDDETICND